MAERDYVVTDLKVGQKATFDMQQILNLIKSWFTLHKYNFSENFYQDIEKEQGKDVKIKGECDRLANDYVKYVIEFDLAVKELKTVNMTNNGRKIKLDNGTIELSIRSYLKRDYSDSLENKPILKFFRAIYDKFIIGDKFRELEKELKDETYGFYNEIKSFLNLHRFE